MAQTDEGAFDEIHILWISEGMSCDGDSRVDHRRDRSRASRTSCWA